MAIKQFISAKTIASRLNKQYQRVDFDPYLVAEWCAQVEVEKVADVSLMWKFIDVELVVGNDGMVLLPCNVFRIIELYDGNNEFLEYNKNQTHLFNIRNMFTQEEVSEDDKIHISYYGVPLDKETGDVLIPAGHQTLCEIYCKLQVFEEAASFGEFDKDMFFRLDQKFSGLLQYVKSSFRNVDKAQRLKQEIVRGNMLPRIGRMAITKDELS